MKEVILGIGNTLKGDDAIGVYIAEKVNKYLNEVKGKSKQAEFAGIAGEVVAINCNITPENYTSTVRKLNPDKLILVDAADMGLSPGSYRIIPPELIESMHFSTHDIPLSTFILFIGDFCKKIVLIGIQPKKMDIGTELSIIVRRSGDYVANLIIKNQLDKIKALKK